MPEGHPGVKPVRYTTPASGAERPGPAQCDHYRVEGGQVHEVAVGPVHAGIIEPGHFRFQCYGENVLNLEISLGFQHRGVEKMLAGGPHLRDAALMECVAGDTSVGHCTAYSVVLERLAGVSVPLRAQLLRRMGLEFERLANHTGDLGAIAGDTGFLADLVPERRYRRRLPQHDRRDSGGNRFGRGLVCPGGVNWDLDPAACRGLLDRLRAGWRDVKGAVDATFASPSVLDRLTSTGCVSLRTAEDFGMVGVAARACGLPRDARRHAPLSRLPLEVGTDIRSAQGGDVLGRATVRRLEVADSVRLVEADLQHLARLGEEEKLREGESDTALWRAPMPDTLPGGMLAVAQVEGWRGELCHVAVTDAEGRFGVYKILRSFVAQLERSGDGPARRTDLRLPALQQELQPFLLRPRPVGRRTDMLDIFKERLHQKYRTLDFPRKAPGLSPRYMGRPEIAAGDCGSCRACLDVCPTGALRKLSPAEPGPAGETGGIALDMGRCLFCGARARACTAARGEGLIRFTKDYRVAAFAREDLIVTAQPRPLHKPRACNGLFSRSLKLREISAAGCNACEADTNVLGTLVYDLGKFGINFVASPRHADGILVTGPVSRNTARAGAGHLGRRARAAHRHRRGLLRHLRRPLRRQRRMLRRSAAPVRRAALRARLPAQPLEHPRRPAAPQVGKRRAVKIGEGRGTPSADARGASPPLKLPSPSPARFILSCGADKKRAALPRPHAVSSALDARRFLHRNEHAPCRPPFERASFHC